MTPCKDGGMLGDEAKVWVDSSSLALGVAIEADRHIIKDASWLLKDDSCHINMAELDAVIKELNLTLSWKVKKVELSTDSSTVHCWISDGLSGGSRLKTKAASEMLISSFAVDQGVWDPAVSYICTFH